MAQRQDNFGVLRLAAAAGVLVSHGFGLTGRPDPVARVTGQTLGAVAVAVFFAISGFLVAGSWSRDPHVVRFLTRRARRIWPGLAVAALFTAYVVGPLFTELPLAQYVDSGGPVGFVAGKVLMLPGHQVLPGVFAANPLHTANGSLWTLPLELQAYLVLALLGLAGAFSGRRLAWASWLACVGAAVGFVAADVASPMGISPQAAYLFAVFGGGALLYRERERVPLRAPIAAALVTGWLASHGSAAQVAIGAVMVPYACLWLAYRTRPVLTSFVERTDLSYGLYLYGYPVEQAIRATLGDGATPSVTIALALPVTTALAFVSWRAIERPWLRRADRVPAPAVSPVPARG